MGSNARAAHAQKIKTGATGLDVPAYRGNFWRAPIAAALRRWKRIKHLMKILGKITAIGSSLITLLFAAQGCAVSSTDAGDATEEATEGDEEATRGDEQVAEAESAIGSCLAKKTCGAGKVCGAWTAYSECGVSACTNPGDVCVLPGRGGGGFYGSSTHTSQRTRTCTMPGGATCVEVQLQSVDACDCN